MIGVEELKYILLHGPDSRSSSQLLNHQCLSAFFINLCLAAEVMLLFAFLGEFLILSASLITGKEVLKTLARVWMLS